MAGGRKVVLTGKIKLKRQLPLKHHRNAILDDVVGTRVTNDNIIRLLNDSLAVDSVSQAQDVDADWNQRTRNQRITEKLLDSCVG